MQNLNVSLADVVGSASFLLTAIGLLLAAITLAAGAWATYQAKKTENETRRLELSYRLMIAAAGGGDARMPDQQTHYSSLQVQIAALAALRAYPEYSDVYERLLVDKHDQIKMAESNATWRQIDFDQRLMNELGSLLEATRTVKNRKSMSR